MYYAKAVDIIKSCETHMHVVAARKYLSLLDKFISREAMKELTQYLRDFSKKNISRIG